ncbi:hypothetical protein NQ315_014871 [Exocentrus adspersus]|uniref:ribonuclease H n=1 Tax=Exocentrus adspersus TaxID=1586481 RepID=A0AAV8VKW2_9CUCU|nr:hypothetical protein NQ315_014871 [Exocentrus adspersus]
MNTALETLRKWFGDNNLTLSTSKSKAILFRKALNVMRALCGTKWGADPASLLNIYKGLIRSHLDYGCQAISPLTKTNEKILNSLQFKALRIIAGCLRSTPTNALLSECAEMDIKHRIIWLTIKYLARVHSISEHPLQSILEDLNEYCLTKEDYWKNREYPAIISAMHFLAPYVQHIKKFRNIPCYIIEHKYFTYELEYIELKLKKSELYEGYCKIYTDGSLDPIQEKVGIGMYVPQYEYSFHDSVPKMAQICTAETIAIHKACTFCLENDIKKAVIFSDSQSALKKLTSNKLNKDLDYITLLTKEMLINCNFNGTIIKLAWVPGHTGIDGNERADKNANLGKQLPITNNILLDKADVLAYCKKKYHNNWIKEWDNSFNHKGKWYKAIQPQFPKTPWFNKFSYTNRRHISTIIRMRTGHCLTDQHKFKIGIADSPLCECGQLGDLDHLFFGCEINKIPTFDLYQTLIQTHNTTGPLNIKCVLYNLTANTASAYDNVNNKILVDKMRQIGLPDKFALHLYELYQHRNLYIRTCDTLIGSRKTSVGLPQGGILSPLLYIIYSFDFETLFTNSNITVYQFADDYAISTQSTKIEDCPIALDKAITKAEKWFNENGSSIAQEKSLNWKEHINSTCKRASNALNILRVFGNKKWGADPNICLLFYRSLVRSILDYGSVSYGSANNCHLNKIEKIKNQGLRLCIGFLNSTPINIMESECSEPPLYLRRQIYMWISPFKDEIYTSDILPCYTVEYPKYNNIPKIIYLDCHRSKLSSTLNNLMFKHDLFTKWRHHEHIFTDGSKNGNYVGSAFYHHNKSTQMCYQLPSKTSSFTAELIGIREALRFCISYDDNTAFVLFSDCKSALQGIQNCNPTIDTNYIIIDILKLYNEILELNKSVEIAWIKGHAGIEQNEIVDKLAKQAAMTGGDRIHNFKIPSSDIKNLMKQRIRTQWNQWFLDYPSRENYKKLQTGILITPWFYHETNRSFIRTICRLRSSHCLHPYHRHKMKLSENPNCMCGELGDLQHWVMECPLIDQEQLNIMFTNLINLNIPVLRNTQLIVTTGGITVKF